MTLRLFYFLIVQCLAYTAYSQYEVKGYVIDSAANEPLYGTSIIVRGTIKGTISNRDGSFTINVPHDSELVFSFVGFTNEVLKIRSDSTLKVFMREDKSEIIVTVFRHPARSYPIRKTETEEGTLIINAEDTVNISKSLKGRVVCWKVDGYQVIVPFDSVLNYLKHVEYKTEDINYVIKYLEDNATRDKIYLTEGVKKRLGRGLLNDVAIELIKCESIQLLDSKNKPVKFLIRQSLEWYGNPKVCSNCCWVGDNYFVPSKGKTNQRNLFRITHSIC